MTERERIREEDRSIGELIKELATNTQSLVNKEIQLAKLELRENVQHITQGASTLAVAAVLGLIGGIMLALAAVYGLSLVLPAWASALIVACTLLVLAAGLALLGLGRISHRVKPEQTIQSLKEDQEWVKQHMS